MHPEQSQRFIAADQKNNDEPCRCRPRLYRPEHTSQYRCTCHRAVRSKKDRRLPFTGV